MEINGYEINKTEIVRQPRPGNDVVVADYCQLVLDRAYRYDWVGLVQLLERDSDLFAAVAYAVLSAYGKTVDLVEVEIGYAKRHADPVRSLSLLQVTRDLQHKYLRECKMDTSQEIGESHLIIDQVLEG